MENISVIIPAYNEEKTIGQVIDIVKNSKRECEIIVVDNCSNDKTTEMAKQKGVKVINCNQKGKGYAMEVGLEAAQNEIVVYIDADIIDYQKNIIDILVKPIIEKDIDFVKSTFERTKGGVVTEVATKPLLDALFPQMYKFSEPLSGMIASKKSLLEKITFEKDYGVDIGIVIDITKMNAKIEEVNIGKIENRSHLSKTTQTMKNMSTEIINAILKKANVKVS